MRVVSSADRYLVLRPTPNGRWIAARGLGARLQHLGVWATLDEAEQNGVDFFAETPRVLVMCAPSGSALACAERDARYAPRAAPSLDRYFTWKERKRLSTVVWRRTRAALGAPPWRKNSDIPAWAFYLAHALEAGGVADRASYAVWRRACDDASWRDAFLTVRALQPPALQCAWVLDTTKEPAT